MTKIPAAPAAVFTAVVALCSASLCTVGFAQVETSKPKPIPLGTPEGAAVREVMWRPPTDEEWKKPVLIKFQRSWADAVQLSKETGRPILVCVNMDGEIASEHYAGVRYRTPEIAKIYEPYICVIASVYRHNPRDYDERGKRILCPRFGSVTCGEHIWIEPVLFGKYFENTRVAPRHIMVELDGNETYDVYYANDTRRVFDTIQRGIIDRRKELARQVRQRPERSLLDKVDSRDLDDREAVEKAFREGDIQLKTRLLEKARVSGKSEPLDLLRLAIYELDEDLKKLAREGLTQATSKDSIEVINAALRSAMSMDERKALIATLERLGEKFPRAKKLAVVHRGLASSSKSVDVADWTDALAAAKVPEKLTWTAKESELEYKASETRARPEDPNARLELAEASLALVLDGKTSQMLGRSKSATKYHRLMLLDAQRAAKAAEKLGAKGWRLDAVLALSAYYLGERSEAQVRAERAVAALPKGETGYNAMGVLGIFAETRMRQIRIRERQKRTWPEQWLTDVHDTYRVLSQHPLGTDAQVATHYDFLVGLSAQGPANVALEAGLKRFPDSAQLHDRLRSKILKMSGAEGLEPAYKARLAAPDATKNTAWFAAYASIVAAEFYRRAGKTKEGLQAYDRAIGLFDRAIASNPASKHTADHFAAIAMAGRARIALEQDDLEGALERLLGSFTRKPSAGGTQDGLNQTPMDTAKLLRTKLKVAEKTEMVARLEAAIAELPPEALVLPDYERNVGPARRQVLRSGRLRRPGWRDRAEARERASLEEARRKQRERLEAERKAKEEAAKKKGG